MLELIGYRVIYHTLPGSVNVRAIEYIVHVTRLHSIVKVSSVLLLFDVLYVLSLFLLNRVYSLEQRWKIFLSYKLNVGSRRLRVEG